MSGNQTRIRLPRLVSDGMVLQRNTSVNIWGWASSAGEEIIIHFMDKEYRTIANMENEWQVSLLTQDAGGPYSMELETGDGLDKVKIHNIMLGDVWVCSGQSNMEMKMLFLKSTYPEDFPKTGNEFIRQYLVPVKYDFEKPLKDHEAGSWEAVTPQSIESFGAVGYFFASKLYELYQIPIGLINASLGGSPAEAWISEDKVKLFPEYNEAASKMKNPKYVEAILKDNDTANAKWHKKVNEKDIGVPEIGIPFYDTTYDASNWKYTTVPSYWEDEGLGHFCGVVWYRREVFISPDMRKEPASLILGHVIDEDTVYINGVKIGEMPFQYAPRRYSIPDGVLKTGKNVIVVRVVNVSGKGGFYKDKPYQLQMGDWCIDLRGQWQYRIGIRTEALKTPIFVAWQPTGLYNAMIAPMIKYAIKGALWYQGETNAQKPENYEMLLKALITDWRDKWNQSELPFLVVQLPNFMEPEYSPAAKKWAYIREAQRRILSFPKTGMAVTIDLGEWNDVHPLRKKEVGYRLALAAQRTAYDDLSITASGPIFQSAKRVGNKMVVSFYDTGSGLVIKDSERLEYFQIAGEDKKFSWAEAAIYGEQVIVWNDEVPEPVHVRYAWADHPEGANLYNKEDLPASPFTTEEDLIVETN